MIISAQYCNNDESAVIAETDQGFVAIQLSGDGSDDLKQEYLEWAKDNATVAYEPPQINSLQLAEAHVASHFSTPRLLQMKVWFDALRPEDAPKLRAVYDWTSAITVQAAQGQTVFDEPPHSFEELIAEAMPFIQAA